MRPRTVKFRVDLYGTHAEAAGLLNLSVPEHCRLRITTDPPLIYVEFEGDPYWAVEVLSEVVELAEAGDQSGRGELCPGPVS